MAASFVSSGSNLANSKVICWICKQFASPNFKGTLRHIAAVHSWDPDFFTLCRFHGCSRTYSNFFSFKKHIYRKHREFLESADVESFNLLGIDTNDEYSDDFVVPEAADQTEVMDENDTMAVTDDKRNVALFILKSRVIFKVPQVHLELLLADLTELIENKVSVAIKELIHVEQNDDQLHSIIEDLKKKLLNLSNLFSGLETTYLQNKFFEKNFEFVYPEPIKAGQTLKRIKRKRKQRLTLDWDYSYYVPLLSSLKSLLSQKSVLNDVISGHRRTDDYISDYCDSVNFKTHPLFSSNHTALQIFLYFDELEICNPLGSRSKKHKLGLFYYTLGNISPKYRSSLQSIQLLAVANSQVILDHGINHILNPVIEDIKVLETVGISIWVDGHEHIFKGTLVVVLGDNLASQYLGGYKALNAAFRKCRHCLATAEDMAVNFYAEEFIPRTYETHCNHISLLHGPMYEYNSTTSGLRCDSVLNKSMYFHVTNGLVPDIMHDVLEGCLAYEIKEFIKYAHSNRYFQLNDLNEMIRSFPYGFTDAKNKPSPFNNSLLTSNDHGLRQNATQIWCLARLLPLMVGEKIDEADSNWRNLLLLLNIVDYTFAPVISTTMIAYLKEMIHDHHSTFLEVYSSCPIIPKMHYMLHYPEWMAKFGPLLRFWVMRFEGKHNFFKDVAHHLKCYRNVEKSMAERHQLYSLFVQMSGFDKKATVGTVSQVLVSDTPYKYEIQLKFPTLTDNCAIDVLSWVSVDGITKEIVVLKVDGVPQFGRIVQIYVRDLVNYYLICEVLTTECFNSHFHSYQVLKETHYSHTICKISDIADHNCLSCYTIPSCNNYYFIPLKYYLVDTV